MNKMQFRQLKSNDETIIHYKIVDKNGYYSRETYSVFCQKPYDEKCDIAALVEDTLHRILEEGASPEDIEEITGLIKNRGEESDLNVDLDYVIPGSPCFIDSSSEPLKETLYQRFKLYWMADHGYTLEAFIKSINEYVDDAYGIYSGSYEDLVSEWELESGFHGTIYPCFGEFIFSEYQEKAFVKQLCHTEEEYEQYLKSPKW